MKFAMNFLSLLFAVLILTNSTYAESPHEQLRQMVEQLQKSPTDNALRENIIKLAQELKPAPAVPEEAERRMARGTAAFKGARSVADYRDAAKEFEQATLVAPWYGDAYFNLGVAQDKAENYEAALHSLKLAQLASPEVKEIKALIYEVEYRKERSSPEVQAAKKKQQEQDERRAAEELIRGLEGAIFVEAGESEKWNQGHYLRIREGKVEDVHRRQVGDRYLCDVFSAEPIGAEGVCRSALIIGRTARLDEANIKWRYEISEDGHEILRRYGWNADERTGWNTDRFARR